MLKDGFSVNFSDEEEMERFMLILNLGVLTGLKKRAISTQEAELYLYEYCCKNYGDTFQVIDNEELSDINQSTSSLKMIKIDRLMKNTIKLLKGDEYTPKN